MYYVCPALDQSTLATVFGRRFVKDTTFAQRGPTLVQRMYEEELAPSWKWQNVNIGMMLGRCHLPNVKFCDIRPL